MDIVLLIREMSELRAFLNLELLIKNRVNINWIIAPAKINKDFINFNIQTLLKNKNLSILDINQLHQCSIPIIAFNNKIKSDYDVYVDKYINFYSIAACSKEDLFHYSKNFKKKQDIVTIGNIKITNKCIDKINTLMFKLSTTNNFYYIVPRHVMQESILNELKKFSNIEIVNTMGVLFEIYLISNLSINGNVFCFDDSEHNPYEYATNCNALTNTAYCSKPEYKWIYEESSLIHHYTYNSENIIETIEYYKNDKNLVKKIQHKNSNVEQNRKQYYKYFIQTINELGYSLDYLDI